MDWVDYIPQETLFWRRRLWEKVGERIDDSFQFAMDWDLLLRFKDAGCRMVRLPRFLGAFRVHDCQKTQTQIRDVGEEEMQKIRRRIHGRDVSPRESYIQVRRYLRRHLLCHFG